MTIRDISLRKRLLIGNFLMIIIPVIMMAVMGWLIFVGIRFFDSGQKSELVSKFDADRGAALSVQFAVNSIKKTAEKDDRLKLNKLKDDCKILEAQGISVVIVQDSNILYKTPKSNVEMIQQKFSTRKIGGPAMLWDSQGFAFSYTSKRHGTTIMAVGDIPFDEQKPAPKFPIRKITEGIGVIFFICTIIFIIMLGRYLSRLLSRQILEPLAKLREVSEQIRAGNLDVAVNVDAQDEIGETCRAFDKMRRELRANKNLREKYEQNRKELLAGISHDLATPLTALKGYAAGILDGIANTPEKKYHYVEMMNQTVCDMEKLVESLFLFSKLDLGRVEFNLEPVCLSDYFADFVDDKREIFLQRGLNLKLVSDNHSVVEIDRLQFTRLVNNLLENSIKYKNSETVDVTVTLTVEKNNLRVDFADNGRGVDKAELQKIFDIFYRSDPARSSMVKGSGLGLAVVKQIVLGMHGEIWAEETAGGGLTISISLPLFEVNRNE